MSGFKQKFTSIKEGYSTVRRIPRLGKIRLGIKKKNSKGIEYPTEVDYFVCPPEVQDVYGEYPRELDVMLLTDDTSIIFPQKLARYGSSKGLICHGNGEIAERLNPTTKKFEERACPCEYRKTHENPKGDCTENSYLMVLLPRVNAGGCYQITTGSYNSTIDINSGIDFVKELIGRAAMVPLLLKRRPLETHHDGKKQIHYPLSLTLDANISGINKLREDNKRVLASANFQIEAPLEENPELDPVDVEEEEGPMALQAPLEEVIEDIDELPYSLGMVMSQETRKSKSGEYQAMVIQNQQDLEEIEVVTREEARFFQADDFEDFVGSVVRYQFHVQGKAKELEYLELDKAAENI